MQSPRFQEILRLTSGRKKRNPDIKSFSHELNSKGVRPFPIWKHRGHMEVIFCLSSFSFSITTDHQLEKYIFVKHFFPLLKRNIAGNHGGD